MNDQGERNTCPIEDIVLPRFKRLTFRCHSCKTLFASAMAYHSNEGTREVCPYCGKKMGNEDRIPLYLYNLIRWTRGDFGKNIEQKEKELEYVLEIKGGVSTQRARLITCCICEHGEKNEQGNYDCIYVRSHGRNNRRDFFCADGEDKFSIDVEKKGKHTQPEPDGMC